MARWLSRKVRYSNSSLIHMDLMMSIGKALAELQPDVFSCTAALSVAAERGGAPGWVAGFEGTTKHLES